MNQTATKVNNEGWMVDGWMVDGQETPLFFFSIGF
jgi:hypothetical protein